MSGSTFGRATFEIRTNKAPFRAGLTEAEADARSASTVISKELTQAGKGLGEGAAEGSRQLDRHLGEAERKVKASSNRIGEEFANFGKRLGEGLTLGGGIAAADAIINGIGAAFSAGKDGAIDYNKEIQNVTNQLVAFTGSQYGANEALSLARREAALGRGDFGTLANAIATLSPTAKTSGESMQELIRLAEILAHLNPEEGIKGAAYSLRELASGDITSIVDRFNIPRRAIQSLREQGVPDIEALRRALAGMGVSFDLVEQSSHTVTSLTTRLEGLGRQTIGGAGKGIFEGYSQGLEGLLRILSSSEVQNAAASFGRDLSAGIAAISKQLGDPAIRSGLREIGVGLAAIGAANYEGLKGLVTVLGSLTLLLGPLGKLAELKNNLNEFIERISGGRLNLSDNVLTGALRQVNLLHDAIEKLNAKEKERHLLFEANGGQGQNNGPGSFPVAGPSPSGGPGPSLGPIGPAYTPPVPVTGTNDIPEGDTSASTAASAAILRQLQAADKAAVLAANNTAASYVRTFTAETASRFKEAGPILEGILLAAAGGDKAKIPATAAAEGYALVARALAEIQATGSPTVETIAAITRQYGAGADNLLAYLGALERIGEAQGNVRATTLALAVAQGNLAAVVKSNAAQIKEAEAGVQAAADRRTHNSSQAAAAVNGERAAIEALRREADGVAQSYADRVEILRRAQAEAQRAAADAQRERQEIIRTAQTGLAGLQQQAAATAAEYDRQIEGAQGRVTSSQTLAREHAEAFAAIQSGTLEDFYREHEAIDDSTRAIIERYNAEVAGKLAAKNAADDRVQGLDEEQRRSELALLTQIRAARGAGNYAEAEALQRQLELERARYRNRSEFARLQASVAGDEAKHATEGLTDEAKKQAAADKRVTSVAQAEVTAIQTAKKLQGEQDAARIAAQEAYIASLNEQDRIAQEASRKALQAIDDQITAIEREAGELAKQYAAREAQHNQAITEIEQRATIQRTADDAAYAAATNVLNLVKGFASDRLVDAQTLVTRAEQAASHAKTEADAAERSLEATRQRIIALEQFNQQHPDGIPLTQAPPAPEQAPPSGPTGGPRGQPASYPENGTPPPPPPGGSGFFAPPATTNKSLLTASLPGGGSGLPGGSLASLSAPLQLAAFGGAPDRIVIAPAPSLVPSAASVGGGVVNSGGDTNFHAPLIDLSHMRVDTDERASAVVLGVYEQTRRAIEDARKGGGRTDRR